MKIEIEVTTKMMQQVGPIPFFIIVYCIAFNKKNKKFPTKKEISSNLGFDGRTISSSLKYIFSKNSLLPTYRYKDLLYSNIYNEFKDSEVLKGIKSHIPVNKSEYVEAFWNWIAERVRETFTTQKQIKYNQKIREWMYMLFERIGEENRVDYVNWWFKEKVSDLKYFKPAIFFYEGIIKEYLDWRELEGRKNPSSKKDVFHQQVLQEKL